tara:strand:- start:1199 stop:1345 length:147 start_codon:yes stop_codon:yes gene_type:complete
LLFLEANLPRFVCSLKKPDGAFMAPSLGAATYNLSLAVAAAGFYIKLI